MYFYNMKKYILFFLIVSISNFQHAIAQPTADTTAPYLKHKGMPNFSMLLHDSSAIISHQQLKEKPLLALIYFIPTCEHCQDKAKQLVEKMDSLQNIYFVWVGPKHSSLEEVHEFATKYKLDNIANVKIGREIQYFLPTFYRMQTTPYTAIYKNNELFVEFRSDMRMLDLIAINNNQYDPKPLMEIEKRKNQSKKYKKPE